MRYVKSSSIHPGMVTATPIYNSNGQMLLAANAHVTAGISRRLRDLGFPGIFVLDKNDDGFTQLLDEKTRMQAIQAVKKLDLDQVMFVANSIVNQVMYASNAVYDMDSVCGYDLVTYMHSVNVALLSAMMGVSMGLGNEDLKTLAQAGLLHDIGKTRVDPHIIKGKHRLSDEEFKAVRMHPKYGYDILAKAGTADPVVMEAVLSHHENEDGTGYPNSLKSGDIHPFAKIIHVADVYDALVSRRSYKKPMNPADALENLMASIGTMFDRACVEALRDTVALYPIGSEVVLSNGHHAWVQENRKGYPTRPLLRTTTGLRIDLMERLNVTILGFASDSSGCMAVSA